MQNITVLLRWYKQFISFINARLSDFDNLVVRIFCTAFRVVSFNRMKQKKPPSNRASLIEFFLLVVVLFLIQTGIDLVFRDVKPLLAASISFSLDVFGRPVIFWSLNLAFSVLAVGITFPVYKLAKRLNRKILNRFK